MQRASVGLGILIGAVVVGGIVGAGTAIDSLQGVGTPNTTVERINSTHAAITWTTEKPTHGYLKTSAARQCGPAWGQRKTVNKINDSSLTRTHLIVAPIYDLNKSQVNLTNIPGNGSLKSYQVAAVTVGETEEVGTSIVKRNLSQTCQ